MRPFFWLMTALMLAQGTASAQDLSQTYTRPDIPSREAFERLNLKVAWRVNVPTDGRRDGLAHVQLLGGQLLVQTRSGSILALDPIDGSRQWRTHVGKPYAGIHAIGANKELLFVTRGTFLYAIDRQTGQLRWEFDMPDAATAAPAADDERVYLCLNGGRFYVYDLPGIKRLFPGQYVEPARPPKSDAPTDLAYDAKRTLTSVGPYSSSRTMSQRASKGAQPEPYWDFRTDAPIEQAPILTEDLVVLAAANGHFYVVSKLFRQIPFEYPTGAAIAAPIGQHTTQLEKGQTTEMAYVASRNFNVYALDVLRGKILWRFTGGAPILKKPEVTDADLFVAPERSGLYRVDRASGETMWRNRDADRFLASNKKFVYAADRTGRLLVLDRERGLTRGVLDTRDFVVHIGNEWTDRLFLAANDGLIVCVHDREYALPVWTKTAPVKKEDKPKEDKGDKKPEEKPKEKEKEKEKDKDA